MAFAIRIARADHIDTVREVAELDQREGSHPAERAAPASSLREMSRVRTRPRIDRGGGFPPQERGGREQFEIGRRETVARIDAGEELRASAHRRSAAAVRPASRSLAEVMSLPPRSCRHAGPRRPVDAGTVPPIRRAAQGRCAGDGAQSLAVDRPAARTLEG